jgi:hypothetical protein
MAMNPNAWQIGKWIGDNWFYMPALCISVWYTAEFIWITSSFWRSLV